MDADASLAELAARQHGLITRGQAKARCLNDAACDRRLQNGQWVRMHPGVYRLSGAPVTWEQKLKAATLALPDSVASHTSAARLFGFPVGAEAIDVTVGRYQQRPDGVNLHRTRALERIDRAKHLLIPTTSVTRTLIDLAGAVSRPTLEAALDNALARRLVPLPYVAARFEALGGKGRKASAVIGELLAERAGQTHFADSTPQRRLMELIKRRGFKGFVPEYRIVLPDGQVIFVDAACPDVRFGIELDSYRWHSSMSHWASDHERHNAATAFLWSLRQVTTYRLERDPEGVGDLIEGALEWRGHIIKDGPG